MTTTKTPRWLAILLAPAHAVERARGRKRVALLGLYGAVALAIGLLSWRELGLASLPDIGDPFDVAAYEATGVADDANAYTLYREARRQFRPMALPKDTTSRFQPVLDWPGAQPEVRAWLAANREALATWRAGTERVEAVEVAPKDLRISSNLDASQHLREFARLAVLEATRLRSEGDLVGAQGWLIAALRSARHVDHQGTIIARLIGMGIDRMVDPVVREWAADERVDARLLRSMLDELKTLRAAAAPNSLALRGEYLYGVRTLRNPEQRAGLMAPYREGLTAWYEMMPGYWPSYLWAKHEPERSVRVYRLYFANLLAYCDLPPDGRPPLVRKDLLMYEPAPGGPATAHVLTPDRLGAAFREAPLARVLLPGLENVLSAFDGQRRRQDGLIVELAALLYLREQGHPPRTNGDLLGRYLDTLPNGYEPDEPPPLPVD